MLALLLAAAAPQTALEAERAFAADAQRMGQWAAFRKWAAADATMFVPQPVRAREWLKDRKDPSRSVRWWPVASYVSCNGGLAVNHGGWRQPDGSVGFFSTVWRREADGRWRWLVDGGDTLKAALPRPARPKVVRASCTGIPPVGRPQPSTKLNDAGFSPDNSLLWEWGFNATGHTRVFSVTLWNGRDYAEGFEDLIAVP